MAYATTQQLVERARAAGTVVPAFNIPYLPMVEPIVRALQDTDSFGLLTAARLEWVKFETGSLEALWAEYDRFKLSRHTRKEYIMEAVRNGIAKINVATATRQPYERVLEQGVEVAQEAVYDAMITIIRDDLEIENNARVLNPEK